MRAERAALAAIANGLQARGWNIPLRRRGSKTRVTMRSQRMKLHSSATLHGKYDVTQEQYQALSELIHQFKGKDNPVKMLDGMNRRRFAESCPSSQSS